MNRALGSLGLAMRSGRVVCGEENCEKLIKSGGAFLVLIDGAISAGSKKAVTDACAYRGVPYRILPEHALGAAIGRQGRMTAAVTDKAFALRLSELLGPADEIQTDISIDRN